MGQGCGVGRGLRWKIKQNKSKFLALSMLGSKLFDIPSYFLLAGSTFLMQTFYAKRGNIWGTLTYCFDITSTLYQQRSECKTLDLEETLKWRSYEYFNLMRSKCLYCTLALLVVLSRKTLYFFYFHSLLLKALSRWRPCKFWSIPSAYVSLCWLNR